MFIVYAYDVKIKKNEKCIPKGEIANSCILKWKKLAFLVICFFPNIFVRGLLNKKKIKK